MDEELKIMKPPSEVVTPEELAAIIDAGGPTDAWLLSPKYDGYYCLIRGDGVFSSSMKSTVFTNKKLLAMLEPVVKWCADNDMILIGELYSPWGTFDELGALRATDGDLDPGLRFYCFDGLTSKEWYGTSERFGVRSNRLGRIWNEMDRGAGWVKPLLGRVVWIEQLFQGPGTGSAALDRVTRWINDGNEGAVLHHVDALYHHGRPSRNSERLLKVKAFDPHDAVIIGVEEGWSTPDTAERKRGPTGKLEPLAKGSKVPSGSFGRFKVRIDGGPFHGKTMYIGRWKGYTDQLGRDIWADPDAWVGKWLRFESMRGAKDLPRIPKNVQFRDPK